MHHRLCFFVLTKPQFHNFHSSLKIEANTLTLAQVSDVIDGKKVLGPEKDILEAKNAYFAYQNLLDCNPYDIIKN